MKLRLESVLFVVGLGLASVCIVAGIRVIHAEQVANKPSLSGPQSGKARPLDHRERSAEDGAILPDNEFAGTYLASDAGRAGPAHVMGRLQIASIKLSVPIISGIADADLLRGVGHIPGSGAAGGLGNMAVAGHRDTFFRPLRNVTQGMVVSVSGAAGTFRYQVDKTEIVDPSQLRVLDIGERPGLTMITCYPFNYIGAAPKRFVVFSHLISADADDPKESHS